MSPSSEEGPLHLRRRDRVLAAMAEADLDALVLGEQANTTYATGMRRLWTGGTRPFGAGAVVVREPVAVHVMASWDRGVPDDVPFDHLYGITWNPRIMGRVLRAIEGLATARRIGVDALSVGFAKAMAGMASDAELVPVDDLLARVRAVKLDDEVAAVEHACSVAATGLRAVLDDGTAAGWRALGAAGCTIPTTGIERATTDGSVTATVGVLVDGYEGICGRTEPAPADDGRADVLAALMPGATGADLAPLLRGGRLRGVGMGAEWPVIDDRRGHDVQLDAGMVLAVELPSRTDVLALGDDGARLLTRVDDGV